MDTLAASIDAFMAPLASALSSFVFFAIPLFGQDVPLVVLWLAIGALFFTFYLRFINIRGFWLAFRHVRGDFKDPSAEGEISHFRALATAISGTVGVGNIGGFHRPCCRQTLAQSAGLAHVKDFVPVCPFVLLVARKPAE